VERTPLVAHKNLPVGMKNKNISTKAALRRAFYACGSVFKVITLVGSNQGNYFENVTSCSKRMRKTTVATQL